MEMQILSDYFQQIDKRCPALTELEKLLLDHVKTSQVYYRVQFRLALDGIFMVDMVKPLDCPLNDVLIQLFVGFTWGILFVF